MDALRLAHEIPRPLLNFGAKSAVLRHRFFMAGAAASPALPQPGSTSARGAVSGGPTRRPRRQSRSRPATAKERPPKSLKPAPAWAPETGSPEPAARPRGAASAQPFTRMQRQRAKGRLSKPGKALTPSQCACASIYCHIAISPHGSMAALPCFRVRPIVGHSAPRANSVTKA